MFLRPAIYAALASLLGSYIAVAEIANTAYTASSEPEFRKRAFYITRKAELMQDTIAIISLRAETEFSVKSVIDDLNSIIAYPVNSNQVTRNIQHLRRSGLVSVDWRRRTVKREKALNDYVTKSIMTDPTWNQVGQQWAKINAVLLNKHGAVNPEYQDMLPKQ